MQQTARAQRAEQHGVAKVGRYGGRHRHARPRRDGEPLQHAEGVIGKRAMADHDALRPPGRARGIDHVGSLRRVRAHGERGGAFMPPCAVIGQRHHDAAIHTGSAGRIGKHAERLAIFEQEGDALGRQGRVDRQVDAASLQHRQQAKHEFDRTFGDQADAGLGANTQALQMARKPVGLGVEFGERQHALLLAQRRCVAPGLDALLPRGQHVAPGIVAPLGGQREFGGIGRRGEFGQGRVGRGGDACGQTPVSLGDARDGGSVEQRGRVAEYRVDAVRRIGHIEREIETRRMIGQRQRRERDAGQRDRLRQRDLLSEFHLHQWIVRQAALDTERVDELVERQFGVRLRAERLRLHLGEQCAER